ncbi:MAG: DUF1345 domain-containing protein [Pseudolabrys sp.]|nr:DUF1345 domain-containing protein [Pseudolabrys sp.]
MHGRLLIAFLVGLAILALLLALPDIRWRMPTKLLTSWDAFALLYLVLVHIVVGSKRGVDHIRTRAAEEDQGAIALLILSCAAALAALGAIVAELGGLEKETLPDVHVALAILTIFLSWAFVHTIFALHYAHEYYGQGRDRERGGLKFPGDRPPDYWDFLYFSLVIAMTSQVSDVQITSRSVRRIALMHGALSFFFNLGILALSINLVSNVI